MRVKPPPTVLRGMMIKGEGAGLIEAYANTIEQPAKFNCDGPGAH